MSLSKTEKDKKEDELSVSISKSMTIDKLKEIFKNENIDISGAKKKADYVGLYISNGLHNREKYKSAASITAAKTAKQKEASLKKTESKAGEGQAKEELIMSLLISAHGIESYEWPPYMPIAKFYRDNVRVYSRACVPGVLSLRNRRHVRQSIDETFTIFKNNPERSTQEIMAEYTGVDRDHYRNFLDSLTNCDPSRSAIKNKERCGGLITYLSQKEFDFTEPISSKPVFETDYNWEQFLASRGINVSDIRLKVTASDGSVTYRNIFNPYEDMENYYRSIDNGDLEHDSPNNITKFNLIYRHGIEFLLKDVLHKEELIAPALEIFRFKEDEIQRPELSLDQLYRFFKLVGIKYVNIIDHSCRAFSPYSNLTEEYAQKLFEKEQHYSVKPVAFGKRSDGKRSDGKRSDGKRSDGKRTRRRSDRKNKYSRKI
jgi:hypothetical protein